MLGSWHHSILPGYYSGNCQIHFHQQCFGQNAIRPQGRCCCLAPQLQGHWMLTGLTAKAGKLPACTMLQSLLSAYMEYSKVIFICMQFDDCKNGMAISQNPAILHISFPCPSQYQRTLPAVFLLLAREIPGQ